MKKAIWIIISIILAIVIVMDIFLFICGSLEAFPTVEQIEKARIVYERLMDLTNDPDVLAPLSFLREREVIHYQRFGELLNKYNKMKNESLL